MEEKWTNRINIMIIIISIIFRAWKLKQTVEEEFDVAYFSIVHTCIHVTCW